MYELSIPDIDRIIRDVRDQEITYPHLADELIDHICCDVEEEMLSGLSFSEAYRNVKSKMGPRRLKEIQEETLYMVDNKYRKMKNAMKISGISGTILYGFAVIFKLQHWPGAGIMMTLGSLIIGLVFMPAALSVLWKETRSKKRIFTYLSAFLTTLFFIAGTLFKIQHWPGAAICLTLAALTGAFMFIPALVVNRFSNADDRKKRPAYIAGAAGLVFYMGGMLFKIMHWPTATILMIAGIMILFLLAFPVYTYITWKDSSNISAVFLYLVIGALLVIIPGVLINLNLQGYFERGFYINQQQQQSLSGYLYDNNMMYLEKYRNSADYGLMKRVGSSTDSIIAVIDKLADQMLASNGSGSDAEKKDNTSVSPAGNRQVINYDMISKPFADYPVSTYLMQGAESRYELDRALSSYRKEIITLCEEVKSDSLFSFPDLSLILPAEENGEVIISLMTGLHSLEVLKNTILTFEGEILSDIVSGVKSEQVNLQ
ncbi:MAG TPA: hypothetical protein VJ963_04340 [Bacteroidales bacterium]|nr:hypothetical protein [Bacteroidales bacterium]